MFPYDAGVGTPRLLALAALAGVVGITLVSTAVVAPAGELVLPPTRTAAERIVADYNEVNANNNATLDIEGQAAIEAPPIRSIDDATFREFQGRGQTTLGDEFAVDDVTVFVPDQSKYPLMFLALERITSPAATESNQQFLVFAKASSDAPWKATFAAALLPDATVPRVATDQDDLATLVTGQLAASLQVNPTKLGPKLARLWQRSARGVAIAKPFSPGLLTTEAVNLFLGRLEQLSLNESRVDFDFTSSESQPVCFASVGDGALCFFVIDYTATLDPVSGSFVQDDGRATLSGLVTPGEYGGVIFEYTAIVLAAVPKQGKLARVDVVGFYNGLVAAEALPRGVDIPADAV